MASDVAEVVLAEAPKARGKDPIASIAGQVANLPTGDRALLRRLYLAQSSSSRSYQADGIVVGLLHRADVIAPDRVDRYEAWRLIAHVAALLSGTGGQPPHAPGRSVGRLLHAAGYSENRLLRLTAARGPALQGQIIRAARMLAQAGQTPVDLWTFFLLAGHDATNAEQARLRIAKDYYAAHAASN